MDVAIVTPAQHESLVDLLCELHAYYASGTAVARELVREHLHANLLAPTSGQWLAVASRDGVQVLGLAAVTRVHSLVDPTPPGRTQLQLKELYVRADARAHGVGRALMAWVAHHAMDSGCGRVDWPVQVGNVRGRTFYERLGAELVAERLSYRLSGAALQRLADAGPWRS